MKTPSFRFRSTIIFVFLFASFFHLRVYANLTDDSPPDLTIEVTGDFDFGSVFFGTQPSQPRQFVIRNIGQEMVTFNVTVSNPDFTYFSDASLTLWPGDSALSYIAFKPSVVGVISGTLTITSNDPVSPVLNFNMAGVGLTSPVEETLIQDTVIELTTTIRPFKITNTSNERSEFHLEAFSGNFVQFPIDTYFLDPGESVWAELRFTGYNYIGIEQAVFQLSHLSIQGIALDPIFITVKLVTLETPWGPFAYVPGGRDIDFGRAFVGSTAGPIVFEIINPSPTPLICHLSSSDINFWIDGPDTTFIVTRDDFFSSSYSFKPLTVGDFSGEILLTTNDPNHPTFLWHVHGEGMDTPFQLVEDTIQVGEQSIQTVTIRNTASVPLSFTLSAERNDEHDSFLELLITPNTIALAPDETATFQVVVDATDFIPGVYYGSIEGNPGQYDRFKVPFILTVVDLPQDIELPDSIIVEVPVGTIQSSSFVIQNTGNTNLNYSIETGSIESGNGSRLYSTGFEEFDLSSIQFMGGWYAADYIYFSSGSPGQVANENPFSGSKHLRYVSSEGEKLFSPISNTSASDISIVDMMIDFEPGVTWKIAAKDHYFSGAGNALVIHPDGSMSVETDFPSDELHSIPGTLPEGYFNLRFSIKKSTQEFSIAVNGDVMYTGPSHISDFSQVVFLGGLEQYGKNLDIDDLRIIVGDEERSFLSAVPSSGTIPPLGSQTVNLLIDAHNIDVGEYKDSIIVHSTDSLAEVVSIPFTANVIQNILPELFNVYDTTMVAGQTLSLTFSATDVDDDLVSVTDFNVHSGNPWNYHLETASGNGYVTYDFVAPETPIDSYFTGMILARDARGGIVSKFLSIHVLGHNENDFALTNFKTNVAVATFTDTVVVDIARPDIDKLTIQFKPVSSYKESPEAPMEIHIGPPTNVQFILDGNAINVDRSSPYYINSWEVPKLSQGDHILLAIANYDGEGQSAVSTRRVIVHVINSTAITDFDVVDSEGVKLMDLVDGSVIDLSQPGFDHFNIIANPSITSIRSVKFVLNNVTARIDNSAPYALGGNPISGDTFWKAKPGQYTLTAIPYMKYFAWGPSGTPLTIHFQVVNGTIPFTATARIANATPSDTQQSEETFDMENVLSIYPVPVKDELHIELHESVKGNVVVNIMSVQGKSMHISTGDANEFRKYSISAEQLGMSSGIYFVMVTQANGKRVAKKFIKE